MAGEGGGTLPPRCPGKKPGPQRRSGLSRERKDRPGRSQLSWLLVPKSSQQAEQPGPAHTPRGPYVHQTPDDPATERTERQAPTGQPPPQPSWEAGAPTIRIPSGSSKHSGRPEGTEDGQTPREGASTRDLVPLTREGPEKRGCWMQGPLRAACKHHTPHPLGFLTVNYSGTPPVINCATEELNEEYRDQPLPLETCIQLTAVIARTPMFPYNNILLVDNEIISLPPAFCCPKPLPHREFHQLQLFLPGNVHILNSADRSRNHTCPLHLSVC